MQLPQEVWDLIWPPNITGGISAAGTIATAFATVFLWQVTRRLYEATQLMAEATARAQVVAVIKPNMWALRHADLYVSNTGNASAFDVQVEFDPPLERVGRMEGRPIPLRTVSVLRPGDSLRCALSEMPPLLEINFTVTTSWKTSPADGARQRLTYSLNMRDFEGWGTLGAADPMIQVADQLKKMREDWQHIARGNRRIGVDGYSSADRAREAREHEEWLEECRKEGAGPKKPDTTAP